MSARALFAGLTLAALALMAQRALATPAPLAAEPWAPWAAGEDGAADGAPVPADTGGGFLGDWLTGIADAGAGLLATVEDVAHIGPSPEEMAAMSEEANLQAFLSMIRVAEGTAGPLGYRTMFGGSTFDDFSDHPRQVITATFKSGLTVSSSAAGAYQFLQGTWDDARRALGLEDFSPANQDRAAVWLIRRRGALDDVRAGRFTDAVRKCAREWASLPGSPYGQPTISAQRAMDLYQDAGGVIVA